MGFLSIMAKDLRLLTRDHRALAVLLLMPMVFIAILGLPTGHLIAWRNESTALTLVVHCPLANPFAKRFLDLLRQREGLVVSAAQDADDARRQVQQGDQTIAVLIGSEFADRVGRLRLRDALQPEQGPLAWTSRFRPSTHSRSLRHWLDSSCGLPPCAWW